MVGQIFHQEFGRDFQGFTFGVANGEFRRGLIQISPKFAGASIPLSYFFILFQIKNLPEETMHNPPCKLIAKFG